MWIVIIISVCSLAVFVAFTMLCVCWRRKNQKNDLLGLDGLVTQKNPDENVNHLPSAVSLTVPDGIKVAPDEIVVDANKRPVTVNNPRRSLPDIPSDGIRNEGDIITYEPNGDNSSDLYATVEPYQNTAKRHTLANGIDTRPSISQHSSISQADDTFSPYARVREHPYDKLKTEHPYARVQPNNSQEIEENSSGEATPRSLALRNERSSTGQMGGLNEPLASSRTSGQNGGVLDIPAATAVAGGIAANQELPYMTPPINQTNFSGDSQDSSKGYTSISVREPLANIRAQTKVLNKMQNDLDPHYSTVSDDSDDMYTTIQDPNNAIYTSGSETYAQIQPPPQLTVAAEININPNLDGQREGESSDAMHERAPQPPSVDSLKHVTHTHSRQASSSSSVGNLGSPKPEKRQANSPLPPPPTQVTQNMDLLGVDRLPLSKNLDDMYAKVQKTKRKIEKEEEELLGCESDNIQLVQAKEEKQCNKSDTSISNAAEHNYETLRKSPRKNSDPGYEKLKLKENEYASEPGYDSITGPESMLSTDPGYEVLKHSNELSLETDPNYEELRHQAGSSSNKVVNSNCIKSENDGYSVVNKQNKHNSSSDEVKSKSSSSYESDARDFSTDEPNYESMPSESLSEHNYAVLKSTGSESDPNYESVHHNDPNYESVKYLDVSLEEPPYEQLHDEDSSKSDSNPSCSRRCPSNEASDVEPGYEKVKDEKQEKEVRDGIDSTDPGYETIKTENEQTKTEKSRSKESEQHAEGDYDAIVQV